MTQDAKPKPQKKPKRVALWLFLTALFLGLLWSLSSPLKQYFKMEDGTPKLQVLEQKIKALESRLLERPDPQLPEGFEDRMMGRLKELLPKPLAHGGVLPAFLFLSMEQRFFAKRPFHKELEALLVLVPHVLSEEDQQWLLDYGRDSLKEAPSPSWRAPLDFLRSHFFVEVKREGSKTQQAQRAQLLLEQMKETLLQSLKENGAP